MVNGTSFLGAGVVILEREVARETRGQWPCLEMGVWRAGQASTVSYGCDSSRAAGVKAHGHMARWSEQGKAHDR